ncbi:NUDIX domain-containing protein [Microlunatus kandeliicorticis]|uniref:NUDIX domain-containing protein n=1 Tax=Microlunatus kandeliicorticis TaxID=1759536 RepID=UPI0038B3BA17
MVQTFNRLGQGLILPGGLVEEGEPPHQAAVREAEEELGLRVEVDRLLAIEHHSAFNGRPSSLQFVFAAADVISNDFAPRLQPDEIAEARWVKESEAVELHGAAGRARMAAALEASRTGIPAYLAT